MTVTLSSRGLSVQFGGHVAVNAVTADFRVGELTAIVGPNGAGKTTYFNLLAPSMVQSLAQALRALKDAKTTILLVEQNFHFVSALGDHVAVMDDGRIVHEGRMADLVAQPYLQERLLGLDAEHAQEADHDH